MSNKNPDDINKEWQTIQAAQHDPAAFRPLYEEYYVPIFRFVLKRTGEEDLAADVTSQVFLKALNKIKDYEYRGVPFSAWLYRIASNEITQYYRNSSKSRVVSIEDEQLGALIDEAYADDYEEKKALLVRLLSELDEEALKLVELRFFEQRPFREVAEILGISENNTKVKVHRIIQRMRKNASGLKSKSHR